MSGNWVGRVGAGVVAVSMTAALSACGGTEGGGSESSDTFDVVVVAPLSGQLAGYGEFAKNAYAASVKVVNENGGILGKKVKMTLLDDKGDPTTGVSALSAYLSSHEKPDLVHPGASSPEVQGTAPFLARKEILTVAGASLPTMNDPAKYPLYFSTNTDYAVPIKKLIDYVKSQGWTRIGLVSTDDSTGDQFEANVDKAIAGSSVEVVGKILTTPTSLDDTADLQKLRASNPEAVIWEAVGDPTLRILQARSDIGWDVPFVGGLSASGADFSKLDPSVYSGAKVLTYAAQVWKEPSDRTAAFNNFYSAVQAEGSLTYGLSYYALTYDELQLVAAAAEQAGSTDPKKIAAALEALQQPPAADKTWVLYDSEGFSPTNHLNISKPDDFAVVQATPLYEGFTGKPSS